MLYSKFHITLNFTAFTLSCNNSRKAIKSKKEPNIHVGCNADLRRLTLKDLVIIAIQTD